MEQISTTHRGSVAIEFANREDYRRYLRIWLERRPHRYLAVPGRNTLIVEQEEWGSWFKATLVADSCDHRELPVTPIGDATPERIAAIRRGGHLRGDLATDEGRKQLLASLQQERVSLQE